MNDRHKPAQGRYLTRARIGGADKPPAIEVLSPKEMAEKNQREANGVMDQRGYMTLPPRAKKRR